LEIVKWLFDDLGPRYKDYSDGYIKFKKAENNRTGVTETTEPMVYVSFVDIRETKKNVSKYNPIEIRLMRQNTQVNRIHSSIADLYEETEHAKQLRMSLHSTPDDKLQSLAEQFEDLQSELDDMPALMQSLIEDSK